MKKSKFILAISSLYLTTSSLGLAVPPIHITYEGPAFSEEKAKEYAAAEISIIRSLDYTTRISLTNSFGVKTRLPNFPIQEKYKKIGNVKFSLAMGITDRPSEIKFQYAGTDSTSLLDKDGHSLESLHLKIKHVQISTTPGYELYKFKCKMKPTYRKIDEQGELG